MIQDFKEREMLPFPQLVQYGNVVQTALMDIDFNNSSVGSTVITDIGGHVFTKIGTGSAVVVNDTTKGNVMQFSGSSYFTTPMVQNISLSNLHFKMRLVFKSTVSSENMVFSTGDYYSSGSIVGGILLTLFNNTGSQLFCTTTSGVFTRCQFTYVVNTWRDLTIEWIPTTKTMIIHDNDSNTNVFSGTVPGGFGDGTQFAIGASYVRGAGNANFQGQIQKIKIEKVL